MKLTILTRHDDMGASSRMRMLQYLPYFADAGIEANTFPLFRNADLEKRYQSGGYGLATLINRYFKRATSLLNDRADLVLIEKEMIQWAPAWFEKWLLRRKKYVLDFDDAIFHNYDKHRYGIVRGLYGRKIDNLMKNAALVMAGNDYLADRASSAGCRRVEIVPTVVDLKRYPPYKDGVHSEFASQNSTNAEVVVGWIGSPYTTKYLQMLEKPLTQLSQQAKIRFRVIGGRPVSFPGVKIEALEWLESEEANMLADCDLGVMPLPDSPWERGKCGYKLIQYMACSKPVIGSPVGVNQQIVSPDIGFLCETESEWLDALLTLARDPQLRKQMGEAGRQVVEGRYCIQQTAPQIITLLKEIL